MKTSVLWISLLVMLILPEFSSTAQEIIKVGENQLYQTIDVAYKTGIPAELAQPYIIELQQDYDPFNESYPITFTSKKGASATNTITIRPAQGVKVKLANPNRSQAFENVSLTPGSSTLVLPSVERIEVGYTVVGNGTDGLPTVTAINAENNTITLSRALKANAPASTTIFVGLGSNAMPELRGSCPGTKAMFFNGAKYVIIDGISRLGDTGITIENPNYVCAQTLFFNGEAMYNVVRNCYIKGCNISAPFYNWNEYNGQTGQIFFNGTASANTIENCDICSIENKYAPMSAFVFNANTKNIDNLDEYNLIQNNNIYDFNCAPHSQTGNPGFFNFPSNVKSNTVILNNRLFWTRPLDITSRDFNVFGMGGASAGKMNRFENNTIGGINEDNEGVVEFNANAGLLCIFNVNHNAWLKNNTIKNIKLNANKGGDFIGYRINNSQTGNMQDDVDQWSGNKVENITLHSLQTKANFYGMIINGNNAIMNRNISSNIIRNITVNCDNKEVETSVLGIGIWGTVPTSFSWNFEKNIVADLVTGNEQSTAKNAIIAMDLLSNAGMINRNFIYNLNTKSANDNVLCEITGIKSTGTISNGTTMTNNVIRLGVEVTSDVTIKGIDQTGRTSPADKMKIYHNTVYIGGSSPENASKMSFAYFHTGESPAIDLRNNILSNVRKAKGSAVNYAIYTDSDLDFEKSNNNLFQYNGALGYVNNTQTNNLAEWKNATSFDSKSIDNVDPRFKNADGIIPDLSIHTSDIIDLKGDASVVVAEDFLGNIRSEKTPSDIGAYAYTFGTDNIAEISAEDLNIVGMESAILFKNMSGKTITVFSADGIVNAIIPIVCDEQIHSIPAGIYIVKTENRVVKVAVK